MRMPLETSSQRNVSHEASPVGTSPSFFVAEPFRDSLTALGLTSLDAVFAFEAGRDLAKANIGRFRQRRQFELSPAGSDHAVKVYLKFYEHAPLTRQLRNWLSHRRRGSFALLEHEAARQLAVAGVGTPRTVAWGQQWQTLFEHRSFLITEQVPQSRSLESALPPCFQGYLTASKRQQRRDFLRRLAFFIRRFHETGYRHRDLYLSHIFCSDAGEFCLIDLARASRPVLRRRFQVKDVAQLHYSAPAASFSRTDRLRFYLAYVDHRRLLPQDKAFIRRVVSKASRMARHNRKRGVPVPFLKPVPGRL
jgi:tRNA A-37 threonylcarbamoyl transferase component Bud32